MWESLEERKESKRYCNYNTVLETNTQNNNSNKVADKSFQPYTKNYKQPRNAERGKYCLFQGRAQQLAI